MRSLRERFDAKWMPEPMSGCWLWVAAVTGSGYGKMWSGGARGGGRLLMAHRVAYELYVGRIPDGMEIDHLCKTPACVCPDHLEAVTPKENNRRSDSMSARRARQTHCLRGHALVGDNLYPDTRGRRLCKTCSRIRDKERSSCR